MVITEGDQVRLSLDSDFNKKLHKIKKNENIMRMYMGKDPNRLVLYIKAIMPETLKPKGKTNS